MTSHLDSNLPPAAAPDPAIEAAIASLRDLRVRGISERRVIDALARSGAPAVPPLIEMLRDRNRRLHGRAARALKTIRGTAAEEALRRYLAGHYARDRGSIARRRLRGLCRLAAAIGPSIAFGLVAVTVPRHLIAWLMLLVAAQIVASLAVDHTADARRAALSTVIEGQDPHDIALLMDALRDEDRGIRAEASVALMRQLNALRASDAPVLPEGRMAYLLRELGGKDVGMIEAVLRALEQVGDERALPAVKRLANGRGAGKNIVVSYAAEACLPALLDRTWRSQSAPRLLRPAERADDTDATLVRPAGANEASAEDLVRPAPIDQGGSP